MSSSKSNSSNATATMDQRTTQTINAGIGGNIGDGSGVISGNYGDTNLVQVSTDGGAFDMARDALDGMNSTSRYAMDTVSHASGDAMSIIENVGLELIGILGESQTKTLNAANDLAARSLDGAMSIKAGQTITEPANQTIREVAKTGAWIAGIGGAAYVAGKVFGGKR